MNKYNNYLILFTTIMIIIIILITICARKRIETKREKSIAAARVTAKITSV